MTEMLSQEEVDNLLNPLMDLENKYNKEVFIDNLNSKDHDRIKLYDFKRPDKFSKDQINTLEMLYEGFARLTTTSLSALLRKFVQIRVVSVDQLTYEEFTRSIPSPTTFCIINMTPLKGSGILEMDPMITFTMIDRLFGGVGEGSVVNRELTDIETSVIEAIVIKILANLREAWSSVVDLRLSLQRIESNPQFAQVVHPNDMVLLITMETKLGDIEGIINFCIPYITIEPVTSKLSAQYWYSNVKKELTKDSYHILKDSIYSADVELIAEIGNIDIRMRDVISLQKGDIIKLEDSKLTNPIILKASKKDKFYCWPGTYDKKMAVKINKVVENNTFDPYKNTIT